MIVGTIKMKKSILILVLAATLFTFAKTVLADPITNPTHFDDTYWYWPSNPAGYTSMDTDIIPIADGSPDGYYFSAYYWFSGDYPATGGYLGLQTEGSAPTGKIAIFSIWGATSSSGPGYNSSGNEGGVFYTSRITYPWVVNNTYDLNISLSSQSAGSNTWTGTITDTTTHTSSLIGNIVVPSTRGNLYDISNTFHERYSGPTASCSDMQESEVEFLNLTANNGTISPTSHINDGPSGSACAADFATQDISGGIETIIGGQFPPVVSPAPVTTPVPTKKVTTPTPTPAPVTTPVPTKKVTTPTPTPTPTPTVTPAPVTTPTPTSTTKLTKPSKPIVTTIDLKTSNKSKPLSIGLAAAYTAGIGIPIILIIFGIFFFERLLPRRKRLTSLSNDPAFHSSPEIFVSSPLVEPTPISYPKEQLIPVTPSTPVINPIPTDPVSINLPQPIQPTIINPTNPPVELPKE
jgi:hypothetical protein